MRDPLLAASARAAAPRQRQDDGGSVNDEWGAPSSRCPRLNVARWRGVWLRCVKRYKMKKTVFSSGRATGASQGARRYQGQGARGHGATFGMYRHPPNPALAHATHLPHRSCTPFAPRRQGSSVGGIRCQSRQGARRRRVGARALPPAHPRQGISLGPRVSRGLACSVRARACVCVCVCSVQPSGCVGFFEGGKGAERQVRMPKPNGREDEGVGRGAGAVTLCKSLGAQAHVTRSVTSTVSVFSLPSKKKKKSSALLQP